jgi:hypothetical protein
LGLEYVVEQGFEEEVGQFGTSKSV